MATENLSVKGAVRSIPELESSILDRETHGELRRRYRAELRRRYRAELRVIDRGVTHRFELQCEGVERYEHRIN